MKISSNRRVVLPVFSMQCDGSPDGLGDIAPGKRWRHDRPAGGDQVDADEKAQCPAGNHGPAENNERGQRQIRDSARQHPTPRSREETKMTDNPMRPTETGSLSQPSQCGARTRSGATGPRAHPVKSRGGTTTTRSRIRSRIACCFPDGADGLGRIGYANPRLAELDHIMAFASSGFART